MTGRAQGRGAGIEHALDLSREGVTLFRRTGSAPWAEISFAPLQLGTLGQNLTRLADIVRRGGSDDALVQIWLPIDQVDARVLPAGTVVPDDRGLAFLFGQGDTGADPLIFDPGMGESDDGPVVAAVRSSVLTETRDFLSPYGFTISHFTTRERFEGLAHLPVFRLEQSAPRMAAAATPRSFGLWPVAAGIGAAALVLLAVGVRYLDGGGSALPPQTSVAQVVLAPDRGPVLDTPFGPGSTPPAILPPDLILKPSADLPRPGAIETRSDMAAARVSTPLPPTPAEGPLAALDGAVDFRDSIPWGFVPGLDVVAMPQDLQIFTAQFVSLVEAPLPLPEAPQSAPELAVSRLDTYAVGDLPRDWLDLSVPVVKPLALDLTADRESRRPKALAQTASLSLVTVVPDRPELVPPSRADETAADIFFTAPDIVPPARGADPRESLELAAATPIRRISARGILIQAAAPAVTPPSRPFAPEPEAEEDPPLEVASIDPTPDPDGEPAPTVPPDSPDAADAQEPDAAPDDEVEIARADAAAIEDPSPFVGTGQNPRVVVLAALPVVIPPERPDGLAPADESGDAADGVEVAAATPATEVVRPGDNPDIAALILRSQEDALAPSPLAITRENAPEARPDAIERAEEERLERLAALAPSENALSSAGRPVHRPQGLARANPPAIPRENTEAVATAPRVVPRPTPDLPTSASVARAATISNALPMRRIALIGVYGKPGARHALIRTSNGRYVKVEPGDRVEGYEVAGIDRNSVRIRRRGRDTLLVIPQ